MGDIVKVLFAGFAVVVVAAIVSTVGLITLMIGLAKLTGH